MSENPPNTVRSARMSDVARLADVSQQTVSRVVNGNARVTPDVKARVEAAIAQLRYRRNPAARALATSRTMSIGIVSFGLAQYGPSVALTGIADEARRAGYATKLVTLGDVKRSSVQAALEHLVADAVDGIVLLAPVDTALASINGIDAGVPLVVFEPGAPEGTRHVATDEVLGAALATRHLLSLGHETVWHVAGPKGWLGSTARRRGWERELSRSAKVAHQPIVGDWSSQSGYQAGVLIASQRGSNQEATAVFVANDQMALGMIKAFSEHGVCVPGDVSVVGFDNVPEAQFYRPALTTVRLDFDEVGRRAVDSILDLMKGGQQTAVPRIKPELLIRSSTAQFTPKQRTRR